MKRLLSFGLLVLLLTAVVPLVATAEEEGKWSGEVVDVACYVAMGEKGSGEGHQGCAKVCVKKGQPMGLLTDDGTLVLLAADAKKAEPYEALKELAGQKAEVSGKLAERDGMKVVTVATAKASG